MIIAFAAIATIYALLILAFCYYWREDSDLPSSIGSGSEMVKDLHAQHYNSHESIPVSVIVACRNEANNINKLVESLLSQSYRNCEFIFVDDHSEDCSVEILKQYDDQRIKIITADNDVSGKKAALRIGFEHSNGEILYFTDADCNLKLDCIEIMVAEMQTKGISMLCGPVCFASGKGFWSKIFQLEFLSLTGSGASGFFMGKPFMCNGANFAVDRKVYETADLNDKYSSGDDVFLLHYAQQNHKTGFAQHEECIVETQGPSNLREFYSQRIRWASKAGGYKNAFAVCVSAIIFLMSLSLLVSFVFGYINPIYFIVFFCLFMMKLIADTYFILPVLRFYGRKKLWLAILPLTIFYPIYIVSVAVASLFYKPKWKGRNIKN